VCDYGQLSEDPLPPAPPADVSCEDGDDDEEQPEAAARTDNFTLEDTVNPLALGASVGSQVSKPARSRAMSGGGVLERFSSGRPLPRGLSYPSSEPVNILDQEKVSTAERISPPERAMADGGRGEARILIGFCNDFRKAYSDGSQGASRHLSDLNEKVEELQAVLEQLEDILQDCKLYTKYVEIKLEDCKRFFERHLVFLKAPGERSTWEKYNSTAEYAVSAKRELEFLCWWLGFCSLELNTWLGFLKRHSGSSISTDIAPLDKGLEKAAQRANTREARLAKVREMKKDKTQQADKETTTSAFLLSSWQAEKRNNGAFGLTRTNILGSHSSPLLSNRRLSFDLVTTEQRDIILRGAEESRPPRALEEEPNVDLDQELDFCLDSLGRSPTGESSSLAEVGGRSSPVPSQPTPLQGENPLPKHETTQNLPPPPTEGLGFGKERESAVDTEAHIEQVSVTQRHQSRHVPLEVRYVASLLNACPRKPDPLPPSTICMSSGCYEYFERALDDTHITRCPACREKQLLSNQRQEEKQQGWVSLDMPSTLRNRLFSETIDINFGTGSMSIDRKDRPEPIMTRTMLWDLTHWFGQFQVMICRWRMGLQRMLTERRSWFVT
jgi:hypothetical protein